jgi:nucleoside-diphosphate-sugar epimerase
MNVLLGFGMGYSALAAARLLAPAGWQVVGTGRSAASLSRIAAEGFVPVPFDGGEVTRALSDAIVSATHVLTSVPPDATGDPVILSCGPLLKHAPNLRWVGYFSTTGVYGDRAGAWVDEADEVRPMSRRSAARVDAERAWSELAREKAAAADIFRLSGIYGPGRSPVERLLQGERYQVFKPGQVFNRIHVEDIAQTVIGAINRPGAPGETRLFNVTDDEPAPPQDVTAYAAELLGLEPPPLLPIEQAQLPEMALSFYNENKRVRNERIKTELGVQLKYPTYREGLRAIFAGLRAHPA